MMDFAPYGFFTENKKRERITEMKKRIIELLVLA